MKPSVRSLAVPVLLAIAASASAQLAAFKDARNLHAPGMPVPNIVGPPPNTDT